MAEAIDTTRMHRVAGLTGARTAVVTTRPCRAPHHTSSDVGLIGGGQVPLPGEVSRAHHRIRMLHAVSKDPWGQGIGVLGHTMMGSHDRELLSPRCSSPLGRDDGSPCLVRGGVEPATIAWGIACGWGHYAHALSRFSPPRPCEH